MDLFLPSNIYSHLFAESLPNKNEFKIIYLPSAVISSELEKNKTAIALIPSFDLLKNKELFVSSKTGMSFEESLSNSYFYFKEKENITDLTLVGDVSSTEVLLSKIIFKEEYGIDVNIEISKNKKIDNKNKLVIGDDNFNYEDISLGLSLSEKTSDLFDTPLPLVNFVIASFDKEKVKIFDNIVQEIQSKILETKVNDEIFNSFNEVSKNFVIANLSSLILNLSEIDREGLAELLKLPYYHGLIKSMIEVKFE